MNIRNAKDHESGERNVNPPQYSCRDKPVDRAASQVTPYRVAKTWTEVTAHTQRIMRDHYEQLYASNLNNLKEINDFLET